MSGSGLAARGAHGQRALHAARRAASGRLRVAAPRTSPDSASPAVGRASQARRATPSLAAAAAQALGAHQGPEVRRRRRRWPARALRGGRRRRARRARARARPPAWPPGARSRPPWSAGRRGTAPSTPAPAPPPARARSEFGSGLGLGKPAGGQRHHLRARRRPPSSAPAQPRRAGWGQGRVGLPVAPRARGAARQCRRHFSGPDPGRSARRRTPGGGARRRARAPAAAQAAAAGWRRPAGRSGAGRWARSS